MAGEGAPIRFVKDPQILDIMSQSVELGVPIRFAVTLAGISPNTHYEWMKKGEEGISPYTDYWDAIKRAEATNVQIRLARLDAAGEAGSWQADMTFLERRYPDEFGRRERTDMRIEGPGEDGAIVHDHRGLGIAELLSDPRARELACELEEAIASGHSDSADDTGGTGEGPDGG